MTPNLASIPSADFAAQLCGPGLLLRTGPLLQRIHSRLPAVAHALQTLYAHHPVVADDGFADFHVRIDRSPGIRGYWRPQVEFYFDGVKPFLPLPLAQAFAMLEWGLNWCIAQHCHHYLIIHAAVIERDGMAAILPAPPGSGKSTLCAALVQRGWRLCSDELTLIDPDSGNIHALARPVSLKNESIQLIADFARDAIFGPTVHDTAKGSVSHMQAPPLSVARINTQARARWIVFPRWQAGSTAQTGMRPKAEAFIQMADNAFNYSVLGERGFRALTQIIDTSDCLSFTYDRLDEAITTFEQLARGAT